MIIIKRASALLSIALLMYGCYPGGAQYVEDYDMTFATRVNPQYDWSNQQQNTYVMPEQVVDISDPDDNFDPINPATEAQILSRVKMNMQQYGYTQLPDDSVNSADYIVLCQRLLTTNWVTYFWGGWGGYYPGWGCPGCWGGWYPPSSTTVSYQTGTLYVTMIDVATSDTTQERINFIWDAGINGLTSGSTSNIQSRLNNGIDKMFEISPYVKKN